MAAPSASGAPGDPELSVSAVPTELPIGAQLTVSGILTDAGNGAAGTTLALQSEAYPFHGFATVARVASGPDGSFSFTGMHAERNVRLRVLAEGAAMSPSRELRVFVDPAVAINASRLAPGATRLSIRMRHTFEAGTQSVSAWWFTAPRGTRLFHLTAITPTRELAAGVTYASAIVNPPAKRFVYRVCLNPSWERAMAPPAAHGPCPQHDFRARGATTRGFEYQGEGRGTPLGAYPSADAIAAARRFLESRVGRTSFAVVDSTGRLDGLRVREHFETASIVKVMMLVAYLRMLDARHRDLGQDDTSLLYPMIHISDNRAASAVLARVGEAAIARVAHEAGMSDYAPGVGWWAFTQTSAADQARFLFALPRLIPPRFYGYARYLMSSIEPSQSWGIPPVARPRWRVFFKTGWLPEEGVFTEVGRLERRGVTFTVAVLSAGEPSKSYGEQTIEGVAARLLAYAP
jgi:hypothetical protein